MNTEPNQDLRPIMALDPAHRGLEGPEMPDEAMDLVLQTLQPLVNRETLTPEEWQVASDALASIRTEAGTGEPDELLRRLAVSQDDNTRADALADLAAWLEVRRPPSSHQWSGASTPPRSWLVEDWLPWGRLAMLTGIGGAGKSRLALQLAAGIASGGGDPDAWIACPPGLLPIGKELPAAGGAVVFATWEEDPVEMDRRLMEIHHDGDAPWVTPERISRLHLVDMAGDGPVWGPKPGTHVATVAGITAAGERLRRYAETKDARLLVIDPLAAAYASDENARGLVRAFCSNWDAWGRAHDCAVLLVAHPPKDGADYAGSTDWHSAVRALWRLSKEGIGRPQRGKGEDARAKGWQLTLIKSNYGPPADPLEVAWDAENGLRWQIRGLWANADKEAAHAPSFAGSRNGKGDDDFSDL
jgi:RecA-family ATPase